MTDSRRYQILIIVGMIAVLLRGWWMDPPVVPPVVPEVPVPEEPEIPDEPAPEDPTPEIPVPDVPLDPIAPNLPNLPQYFEDWADTVRGDERGIITTTDQWRTAFEQASDLLIGGTGYVEVEGRTESIEFILSEALGIADQPFDQGIREALADALEHIAATVVYVGQMVQNVDYRPLVAILTAVSLIEPEGGEEVLTLPLPPPSGIDWITRAEAAASGKPTWVHFSAPNCPPCIYLEEYIFHREDVVEASRMFACVSITDPQIAATWGVWAFPADIFVGTNWRFRGRYESPRSDFAEHLQAGLRLVE